jgi:hypothetical protein
MADVRLSKPTTINSSVQGDIMTWRDTFALNVNGDLGKTIDFPAEYLPMHIVRVTLTAGSVATVRTGPAAIDCAASLDVVDSNGIVLLQDVSTRWVFTQESDKTFRCEFQPADLILRNNQSILIRCPEMDINASPTVDYGISIVSQRIRY